MKATARALYVVLGITASAVILKIAHKKYRQKKDGRLINNDGTTPHESIALLKPIFERAAQQAKSLSLDQNDQLMVYGLYKQSIIGNVNISAPNRLNMVARAKYDAWGKFNGMPQHFAMMKYVEIVEHFTIENAGKDPSSSATGAEGRILDMMDDSDIIYDDDHSSVDLSESNEDDNEALDLGHDSMMMGSRQSTLGGNADETSELKFHKKMSIMEAAGTGDATILRQAIENGNDVNEEDENGQTALHMAADKGDVECIALLLDKGADPNATDKEGISILEAAVIGGCVGAVKLLLAVGADPDHEDMDGDTPRSCAEDDDNEEMKSLLREAKRRDEEVDNSFQSQASC